MCNKTECPEQCFNLHEGSIIALTKLFEKLNVKTYIVGKHEKISLVKEK